MSTVTPKLLTQQETDERFDMSLYDPINSLDRNRVLFFDGDTTLAGDLNSDWAASILEQLGEDTSLRDVLVMVNGNLNVEGDIVISDYHPILLVIGNVYCDVLQSADETIHITGDAHIKYAFYGYYNDGSITISGKTYVPYVLNSDHSSAITPEAGAVLINTYSDHDDFFEYDYTDSTLPDVVVPAAFNAKGDFDAWKFIEIVRSGQSPLKEGAKPLRLVYGEELERITSGNVEEVFELDWSEKKLNIFPPGIARLKNLKKLILSKNKIREIPAIIGELQNLEELEIRNCYVITIPEAICKCKKLRVLNLGANHDLEAFPETIGDLQNLQKLNIDYIAAPLPESIARLDKLEELSMYQCYKDGANPAPFPQVLTRLKNLKRLDLRENRLQTLPGSILNIQTLEEFSWTGSSAQNHIHNEPFPDFSGFRNLKKLRISGKFNTWKHEIFNITTLEHLDIDRNSEKKEYLTHDMLDLWTEMAPEQDQAFQDHVAWVKKNSKPEPDGRLSYIVAPGMNPEDLQDLIKLPNLKHLDLSFNGLTWLPDTVFQLKNLAHLNLKFNKFSGDVQEKITAAFPNTEVLWR